MTSPLVSVIIPTYNGLRYLQDCLVSVSTQGWRDFETIVVENASTDGSAEFVRTAHPTIRLVQAKTNLGFAGGCNLGAQAAQGTWLVFLNNDTVVEPDWLEQLMAVAHGDVRLGACTSKIRAQNDPARLDAIGSYLTRTGFLQHVGLLTLDRGQYDHLREIFSPKGVAFAIRRDLFEAIGGFDERYFAYFEETDLFWQVWLRGYRVGFAPWSLVYHKIGGTALTFSFAFMDYHSFKNRIRTIVKNAGGGTLCWMLPLHLACCLALALIGGLRRPASSWAILRAIAWNVWHLGETWQARAVVQRARWISDRALLPLILRPIPLRDFAHWTWMMLLRSKGREQWRARVHEAGEPVRAAECRVSMTTTKG